MLRIARVWCHEAGVLLGRPPFGSPQLVLRVSAAQRADCVLPRSLSADPSVSTTLCAGVSLPMHADRLPFEAEQHAIGICTSVSKVL